MVLTQLVFAGVRYVTITNVGQGPGSLRGWWLCQRQGYFELPDIELGPAEGAAIVVGDGELSDIIGIVHIVEAGSALGTLDPLAGEMALYEGASFSDPNAMRGYVRWGEEPPAGRSDTAIAAGLWIEDGTIPTTANVLAITVSSLPAQSPDDWATDIGV